MLEEKAFFAEPALDGLIVVRSGDFVLIGPNDDGYFAPFRFDFQGQVGFDERGISQNHRADGIHRLEDIAIIDDQSLTGRELDGQRGEFRILNFRERIAFQAGRALEQGVK